MGPDLMENPQNSASPPPNATQFATLKGLSPPESSVRDRQHRHRHATPHHLKISCVPTPSQGEDQRTAHWFGQTAPFVRPIGFFAPG